MEVHTGSWPYILQPQMGLRFREENPADISREKREQENIKENKAFTSCPCSQLVA